MSKASTLVRRLTTFTALAAITALTSCTPVTPDGTTPDGNKGAQPDKPPAPVAEDIKLDGFDVTDIKGARFKPEGLGNLAMVRVSSKKKLSLDKQRKNFAKAVGAKQATEAQILATMLTDTATNQSDDQQKAIYEEAKQILLQTQAAVGEDFDAILLRMLFTTQMRTGDEAGAAKTGAEMITRFNDSSITDAIAPWIAYYQLRQDQTAEATTTVSRWQLDQLNPNSDYPRAYVIAWVALRNSDYDTAKKAILWAAKNWKGTTTVPVVVSDMLHILARSGTPIDEVMGYFIDLSNDNVDVQYEWLYKLYEGYESSGYPQLAAGALEKALEIKGASVPPLHFVSINQRQVNNYLSAHEPAITADKMIATYNGLAPCGQPCAASGDNMAQQLSQLAQHFHTLYSATQDDRYYAPAEKLYKFYISLQRPDAAVMQSNLTSLEDTKKRMPPNSGKHDKRTMDWSTGVRSDAIKACYESILQTEPTLVGELSVTLEFTQDGTVSGASTQPAAGAQGLAAVGACVQERARTWVAPARTKPGKTTTTRTYKLSLL